MTKKILRKKLREAKALIEDPKHWSRGAFAKSKGRYEVQPSSPEAVRWCAVGACKRVARTEFRSLTIALEECLDYENIVAVNDRQGWTRTQSHKAILDAFDCAIEKAK